MADHFLKFELAKDTKDLFIHADAAGLRYFASELQRLAQQTANGERNQIHIVPDVSVGNPPVPASMGDSGDALRKVTIRGWPLPAATASDEITPTRMPVSALKRVLAAQGIGLGVDVSGICVHDGVLLRTVEDPVNETLTMDVVLPIDSKSNEQIPRRLIFSEVFGYQIFEGTLSGCPTLLDLFVEETLGTLGKWSRLRLETTHGYRILCCTSVRLSELGSAV